MNDWKIYFGRKKLEDLGNPPPWRDFSTLNSKDNDFDLSRGRKFVPDEEEIEFVNAALYLRRPLLVTGKPGRGKSSLAYSVSQQLRLGKVLRWSINSRSTLNEGLYQYDAIARLRDATINKDKNEKTEEKIGDYIKLGPLGTALVKSESKKPRVLLIDEIDKSDIDLPNDLLHVLEEGRFEIPELVREARKDSKPVEVLTADIGEERETVKIENGIVYCRAFPFILLTSNGEKELPPAFYRRCLRLELKDPDENRLKKIIKNHLPDTDVDEIYKLLEELLIDENGELREIPVDQLLNVVFLISKDASLNLKDEGTKKLLEKLLREIE